MLLVLIFTLVAGAGQVLNKTGTNLLGAHPTLATVITDVPLIAGVTLYGFGAVLMVLALRHGELSVLYPLISLSYVWVAILSVWIFRENMNPLKIAGICVIMAGVAILGKGSHR